MLVTRYEGENHAKADELAKQYLEPYKIVRLEQGDEESGYAYYDVNESTITNPNFRKAIHKLAQEYIL